MKQVGRIKYIWTLLIAIIFAVGAGLSLPIFLNSMALINFDWQYTKISIFAIVALLALWFDYQLFRAAEGQRKRFGSSSLLLALSVQTLWLVAVGYLLLMKTSNQAILLTMTVPFYLVGVAGLIISLIVMKQQDHVINVGTAQKRSLFRWNIIISLFFIYALLFFGLTANWMTGITIAVSVGLIIDPAWAAYYSGAKRQMILNRLTRKGVVLSEERDVLPMLRDVKNIVIEKSGLLTTPGVMIRTIQSYDDRYSDFDILGIATGLATDIRTNDYQSPLAVAIKAYADAKGVFPSKVSEPRYLPEIGIEGVINNGRYAFVSATYAQEHYGINERHFGQINALGNSVSYVVEGERVIGVVAFHAPATYSIMSLDRFFLERSIKLHVISADTRGSVEEVTQIMNSVVEAEANLKPADKIAKQQAILDEPNTILITNQEPSATLNADLVIAVGDRPKHADIKIWAIEDLVALWEASGQLAYADSRTMTTVAILKLLLLVLASGLGMFLVSWLFIAPIIAVGIRLVVTLLLKFIAKKQTNK